MFKKRFKNYVSPIDRFLTRFDETHKPSPSQQAEIDKYRRIMKLRDHPEKEGQEQTKQPKDVWDGF